MEAFPSTYRALCVQSSPLGVVLWPMPRPQSSGSEHGNVYSVHLDQALQLHGHSAAHGQRFHPVNRA